MPLFISIICTFPLVQALMMQILPNLQMQNQITRNVENANRLDWIFCEYLVLKPVPLVANFWRNFTYNKNKTSAKNDDLPSRGVVYLFEVLFHTEISWWGNNHTKKTCTLNLNQTVKCGDEEWKKFPSQVVDCQQISGLTVDQPVDGRPQRCSTKNKGTETYIVHPVLHRSRARYIAWRFPILSGPRLMFSKSVC